MTVLRFGHVKKVSLRKGNEALLWRIQVPDVQKKVYVGQQLGQCCTGQREVQDYLSTEA